MDGRVSRLSFVGLGREFGDRRLGRALARRDGRPGGSLWRLQVQRRGGQVFARPQRRGRLRRVRAEGRRREEGLAQFGAPALRRRLQVQRGAGEDVRRSHGLPRRQGGRAVGRLRERVAGRVHLSGGLTRRDRRRTVQVLRHHLEHTNTHAAFQKGTGLCHMIEALFKILPQF